MSPSADGDGEEEAPAKGLFALPFMRRAQERRKAQAQAEAAAMLRDMEAADARGELPSDDEAADWAAAEPAGGHGGRLRFGGGAPQQQRHLVRLTKRPDAPVPLQYGLVRASLLHASICLLQPGNDSSVV